MATHSSILARKIPWTGEAGGLQSYWVTESDTTERLSTHMASQFLFFFVALSMITEKWGSCVPGWSESQLWIPSVGDGFALHLVRGGWYVTKDTVKTINRIVNISGSSNTTY